MLKKFFHVVSIASIFFSSIVGLATIGGMEIDRISTETGFFRSMVVSIIFVASCAIYDVTHSTQK